MFVRLLIYCRIWNYFNPTISSMSAVQSSHQTNRRNSSMNNMHVNYSKIAWKYRFATFKIRLQFGAEFLAFTFRSTVHVLNTTKCFVFSIGTERVCSVSNLNFYPSLANVFICKPISYFALFVTLL